MQAKRKVLARFPDAKLVQQTEYHWSVQASDNLLDFQPKEEWQGKTAAWRTAYFWCHRNPEETLVLPVDAPPPGPEWRMDTGNQFNNRWVRA